jgi:hypothetical protein
MRAVGLPDQVVLEAEVSRDIVPLRNAYRHVGQRARVRVNGGIEYSLPGGQALCRSSHSHVHAACDPAVGFKLALCCCCGAQIVAYAAKCDA